MTRGVRGKYTLRLEDVLRPFKKETPTAPEFAFCCTTHLLHDPHELASWVKEF
jgi:hypothetical protein